MPLKVTIHGDDFFKVNEENQTIDIHDKWKKVMTEEEHNSVVESFNRITDALNKEYAQFRFAAECKKFTKDFYEEKKRLSEN